MTFCRKTSNDTNRHFLDTPCMYVAEIRNLIFKYTTHYLLIGACAKGLFKNWVSLQNVTILTSTGLKFDNTLFNEGSFLGAKPLLWLTLFVRPSKY